MPGERLITFDHKLSYELNQIYSDISNYMQHTLIHGAQSKDMAIYTYLPIINRDGSNINESMVNYNLYIEMYASYSLSTQDLIKQTMGNFFEALKNLAIEQTVSKKNTPNYVHENIVFITIEKLAKTFPKITLSEAIDRFTCNNGPTAVIGACKKINDKTLFIGLPTADEYDSTVVLYVFNENNNRSYPIIKASVRPKIEVINKQILSDIPELVDSNIFNNTIFDERKSGQETIGLTVYLSNVLRINLKKYHISEVVHAP
ncbi:hypothetical protein FACS1894218_3580 [Bacilli bacterium]|nr:hypothetical protein FACS1894218_3580 [Bacilli bacterium]